jgi:aldose 1-epimerase
MPTTPILKPLQAAQSALAAILLGSLAIPAHANPSVQGPSITTQDYGKLPDGREAHLYTLTNKNGMIAKITDYGAILAGVWVPDAKGHVADVTLGYDSLAGWLTNTSYFGASVGRFGNRIADGKFQLDGVKYQLAKNNKPGGIPCHLHGGNKGSIKFSGKASRLKPPKARV